MKSLKLLSAFLLFFSLHSKAQGFNNVKNISVTGTATMQIIPDQIFLSIELTEYEKRGQQKTELTAVKDEFITICKTLGISEKAIAVDSYEGLSGAVWRKFQSKKYALNNTIKYLIEFNNIELIEKLLTKLNDDATSSVQITKVSHSNMTELLKDVRKQAIKAAKEKASYLCEAVNEKVGEVLEINEPENYEIAAARENRVFAPNIALESKSDGFDLSFKKITISYSLQAKFRIL